MGGGRRGVHCWIVVRGSRSWSEGSMRRVVRRWVARRGRRWRVKRAGRWVLRMGCQGVRSGGGRVRG